MGSVLTVLSSIKQIIFTNVSGLPLEDAPISYLRAEDFTISGLLTDRLIFPPPRNKSPSQRFNSSSEPFSDTRNNDTRFNDIVYTLPGTLRQGVQEKWNQALHSMIFLDLNTRRLLWPIIQKRMDRMEASLKYTNCNLEELKQKFVGWDDKKIFQIHDLFQAFEVDGDGLIEIAEMSVGLDNLGDKTSMNDRIPQLCSGDEDGTGSIDFEEFLQILYEQQEILHTKTPLSRTFINVNNDVKFIRWMSTVQQIRSGFL